jgi:hypothetical protein
MFGRARATRAAMTVSLALLGAASACGAQGVEDSDFLGRRAAERCRRGEFERALGLFRQALEHGRSARALGEMGACELRVARWADAEAHLRDALAQTGDPWLGRHRAQAEAWLAEAQSHVGRLLLTGGVPGAEVLVGERVVATLPMTEAVVVPPGIASIEVRAPGRRSWRRALDVAGGATVREFVSLDPEVVSEPAAPAPAPLDCGAGSVLRGGLCYATEEAVAARRGTRPAQVLAWVGASVSVVAGATALGLGVAGASDESDYLSRCGGAGVPVACERDRADTQAALDARAGMVNGFAAAAIVGAVLAVSAIIIDRGTTPPRRAVAVGPTGLRVRW